MNDLPTGCTLREINDRFGEEPGECACGADLDRNNRCTEQCWKEDQD